SMLYITGRLGTECTFGSTTLTSLNGSGFIAKMDTAGNWIWAKKSEANIQSVAINEKNELYLTGEYTGTVNLGNHTLSTISPVSMYVGRMDTAGYWIWVKSPTGTSDSRSYGVSLACKGDLVYIGGDLRDSLSFGNMNVNSFPGKGSSLLVRVD